MSTKTTFDPATDVVDTHGVKPYGQTYLCQYIAAETQVGSIIIPDTAREAPGEAIVLAAGDGIMNDQGMLMTCDLTLIGKRVMLGKYVGAEMKVDDVVYIVVKPSEIIAVLE
jgi:chaperonin GroES